MAFFGGLMDCCKNLHHSENIRAIQIISLDSKCSQVWLLKFQVKQKYTSYLLITHLLRLALIPNKHSWIPHRMSAAAAGHIIAHNPSVPLTCLGQQASLAIDRPQHEQLGHLHEPHVGNLNILRDGRESMGSALLVTFFLSKQEGLNSATGCVCGWDLTVLSSGKPAEPSAYPRNPGRPSGYFVHVCVAM